MADARPDCLMIIDVQEGFIGAATEAIPDRVAALQERFRHVVVTRFVNPEGSPYRRLIGWSRLAPGSAESRLAFAPRADALMLEKSVYTAVSPTLLSYLEQHRIERVHLCGIATDNCVLATAVDLFQSGHAVPVVLVDYCASHGGAECHAAALTILPRLIGRDQVVSGKPEAP
jgi:nicotinamidase-related amidase